jgi:phage recombination protein Bet
MSTALATLTNKFSERFGLGSNQSELIETLKSTAFKGGNVTDAQMTALMLVAQQYNLNPWLKEIYAFPDKGGIVPIVGVDGWARIMNDHPQFDGMEFEQGDDFCTCIIFRKDRSHPTKATEYMAECRRDNAQPWKSHPKRMLRHKAMIQCARLAFGFGGIYDQDEAERIVEQPFDQKQAAPVVASASKALPAYSEEAYDKNIGTWQSLIQDGKKTADQIIAMVSTKAILSEAQKTELRSIINLIVEA